MNNYFIKYLNVKKLILIIILLSVLLSGCTDNKKYLGTWECQENNDRLTLLKDGTFVFDSSEGNGFTNNYKVIDRKIHLNFILGTQTLEIQNNVLIDEDGDLWTKIK
jgi:hypothetical protein